jgi:DNA-binding FadR family transcriptional regulator
MSLWSEIGDLVWLPLAADRVTAVAMEHDAIIDAIERRDPTRARELAEEHVAAETERLLALKLRLTGSAAAAWQNRMAGAAGC